MQVFHAHGNLLSNQSDQESTGVENLMARSPRSTNLSEEERLAAEWAALAKESEEPEFGGNSFRTNVLNQDEIDSLLGFDQKPIFDSVAGLKDYLNNRSTDTNKTYGIFESEATMVRFSDFVRGDAILSEIRELNHREGQGTITIADTGIELINFSCCPNCNFIYSMAALQAYYRNPQPDPRISRRDQFRMDTRVCCRKCRTWFLPALLIVDETPWQERQFLCRIQTVEAVERHYQDEFAQPVLTRRPDNIQYRPSPDGEGTLRAVRNDVSMSQLPTTLAVNLLQYTPPPLMLSFLSGENLANGDMLFGTWF